MERSAPARGTGAGRGAGVGNAIAEEPRCLGRIAGGDTAIEGKTQYHGSDVGGDDPPFTIESAYLDLVDRSRMRREAGAGLQAISTSIVIAGDGHKIGEGARCPGLLPHHKRRVHGGTDTRVDRHENVIRRRVGIVVPNGICLKGTSRLGLTRLIRGAGCVPRVGKVWRR